LRRTRQPVMMIWAKRTNLGKASDGY
jgi:hypothetical protein